MQLAVGAAQPIQRLDNGQDHQWILVRFLEKQQTREIHSGRFWCQSSLLLKAHRRLFPGNTAAEVWSLPLTSRPYTAKVKNTYPPFPIHTLGLCKLKLPFRCVHISKLYACYMCIQVRMYQRTACVCLRACVNKIMHEKLKREGHKCTVRPTVLFWHRFFWRVT